MIHRICPLGNEVWWIRVLKCNKWLIENSRYSEVVEIKTNLPLLLAEGRGEGLTSLKTLPLFPLPKGKGKNAKPMTDASF
jgi:hypothetical protein